MNEKERMHFPNLSHMDPTHKGWLFMVCGGLLLGMATGILSGHLFSILMAVAGLYLLVVGFVKAQLHIPLQKILQHYSRK